MNRPNLRHVVAVVLAAVLAGCGWSNGGRIVRSGETWILVEGTVDGESIPVHADHPITLHRHRESGLGGHTSCNSYDAPVRSVGQELTFGQISATELSCPESGLSEAEDLYLDALDRVDTATRGDDGLTVTGPDVALRFELEE